jgi:hypothetical protein
MIVFNLIEWAVAALLAFGASVLALKKFNVRPLWAVAIAILVLIALQFPIQTHAVKLSMPAQKAN